MKKLNYNEEKFKELIIMLNELGFKHTLTPESIEVSVDETTRRKLGHELSRIYGLYPTPPISHQYNEDTKTISIFDTRLR